MQPKLRGFIHFFLIFTVALGFAGVRASAQASAQPAGNAVLRGHIVDPTGALIPGARVTVMAAAGTPVASATADAAGGYVVRGLAAGSYVIQASSEEFTPYVSAPIQVAAREVKTIDVKMSIASTQQQVEVTAEGAPTLSTEADQNSSAVVIQGKDLQGLSDDPDELSNELTALAGPSAGPNGGQMYINGFTGGDLPPKASIREIRINQNPFSAEYDRLGYGRIEILTKPGTDKLHGRFFIQGNDDTFNTGNPFTQTIPAYHSIQYNGTVSGPMTKSSSFFFSAEQRFDQNASIYSLLPAPVLNGSTWSLQNVSGALFHPETHTSISPRIDLQLGQKNTLTVRYQYFSNNESGDIGSTSLPSQSTTSDYSSNDVQIDDTQVISDRLVNETRVELRRTKASNTPVSTAPTFNVPGSFTGGGNSGQFSNSTSDHLELQEIVTMTAGPHAIKFGAWLRDNRQALTSDGNFNGTFNFPTVAAFVETANGGTVEASSLKYTTGAERFQGNVFDGSLYFQDDWKVKSNLTLSGGLRWETQNHTADHDDWAPRIAFAYSPKGRNQNGGPAKTVFRGGFGFFYDRFGVGSLMNLEQLNGGPKSQTLITIANPTCFNATSLSDLPGGMADVPLDCGAAAATPNIYQISPTYRAPYSEQLGGSMERQLTRSATVTLTYVHSYGVHQLVTRDSNAYLPGDYTYNPGGPPTITAPRPNPNLGIVHQYFPEAIYKQNQVIVNVNAQFSPRLNVSGFYNWTNANGDGGGGSSPSNSYNLLQDYGRAGFVHSQMVFLMGSYTAPWAITFNPFVVYQSGRPYNFTSPNDLTGDAFFNSRPSYASAASAPGNVYDTAYGNFDTVPQASETLVPINVGNSPSGIAVNLRVGRSFGIGPKTESAGGPPPGGGGPGGGPGGGGPPPGGGGGGGRGGGPGGGFGGFGGGGMRGGGGGISTGHKYSLNFNAQALNIFNNIDLGTPVGNVTASSFGHSTSLSGGIFSSGSAARRIFFQTIFQF